MTAQELALRLEKRAEEEERISAMAPVAAVLRDVVRQLGELNGASAAAAPDQMLTLEEAGARLGVSPRWLRENKPPYLVLLSDRTFRVSERKLYQFLSTHQGNGTGS